MHIDAVIAKISEYSTSVGEPISVIEFGAAIPTLVNYVVVSQEYGIFRINTHYQPGQQSSLRLYVRKVLSNALVDKTLDDGGSQFEIYINLDDVPDRIFSGNDDGTISQERVFRVADLI